MAAQPAGAEVQFPDPGLPFRRPAGGAEWGVLDPASGRGEGPSLQILKGRWETQ